MPRLPLTDEEAALVSYALLFLAANLDHDNLEDLGRADEADGAGAEDRLNRRLHALADKLATRGACADPG